MSDLPPPNPPEVPTSVPPPEPPMGSASTPPPVDPVASSSASTTLPPLGSSIPGGDPLPKDDNEKMLGVVMHLIPLAGVLITSIAGPFGLLGPLVPPLILWLIKKDQSPYLDAHGKEVLNFQINVAALSLVCMVLVFVCIGFFLLIALGIGALVLMIMAAIKVNEGQFYRYPYIYRVIK